MNKNTSFWSPRHINLLLCLSLLFTNQALPQGPLPENPPLVEEGLLVGSGPKTDLSAKNVSKSPRAKLAQAIAERPYTLAIPAGVLLLTVGLFIKRAKTKSPDLPGQDLKAPSPQDSTSSATQQTPKNESRSSEESGWLGRMKDWMTRKVLQKALETLTNAANNKQIQEAIADALNNSSLQKTLADLLKNDDLQKALAGATNNQQFQEALGNALKNENLQRALANALKDVPANSDAAGNIQGALDAALKSSDLSALRGMNPDFSELENILSSPIKIKGDSNGNVPTTSIPDTEIAPSNDASIAKTDVPNAQLPCRPTAQVIPGTARDALKKTPLKQATGTGWWGKLTGKISGWFEGIDIGLGRYLDTHHEYKLPEIRTPVQAVQRENLAALKEILKHPFDRNNANIALVIATARNRTDLVEELIGHPEVDVNTLDREDNVDAWLSYDGTPSTETCGEYYYERTFAHKTPLMIAARENDSPTVKALLNHPRIETDKTTAEGETALMFASSAWWSRFKLFGKGNVPCLLVEKGADANKEDKKGEIALGKLMESVRNQAANHY